MGKNSGYLCKIDTGGLAIARHSEQRKEFTDVKKSFIRYLNVDYTPVVVDGKEKTGIINSSRLKVIGMYD